MDPLIHLRTGPVTPLLNTAPHPSLCGLHTIRRAASIQAFLHTLLETAAPHPHSSSNNPDHIHVGTSSLATQPLLDTALVLDPHAVSLTQERLSSNRMVIPRSRAPSQPGPLTPSLHSSTQRGHLLGPAPSTGGLQGPGRIQHNRVGITPSGLVGKVVLDTCIWGGATADSAVWGSHSTKRARGERQGARLGQWGRETQETPQARCPPWGSRQARPGQHLPQGHQHVKPSLSCRGEQRHTRALKTGEPEKQALSQYSDPLGVRRQTEVPSASTSSGDGGGPQEFPP